LDATFAEFAGLSEPAAADDRSWESEKGSTGNSFHNPEIDPADGLHDSSCAPGSIPADGNVHSTLDDGIDGERTKAGPMMARVDSSNHGQRANAVGKARGIKSHNDDAVESSNSHNNSTYHKTPGSGRARKPPAKNL